MGIHAGTEKILAGSYCHYVAPFGCADCLDGGLGRGSVYLYVVLIKSPVGIRKDYLSPRKKIQ